MIKDLFSLSGKTAVVTGGGKGLGGWISAALLAGGADVYITSRNAEDCYLFAEEMNARGGGECVALPFDLSNLDQIRGFVGAFSEREDSLDILVNNAGVTWGAELEDFPEKGWDRVVDLNLKSPFFLVQQFLPLLRKAAHADAPARIVNIGSAEGLHAPMLGNYSYSASKAGLHHLTRHLARHLAPSHINVNTIAPGAFVTKMMKQPGPEVMKAVEKEIPMGRMGGEGDIEGAVIYLCSAAGRYVTGSLLAVDGGWSGCL